MGPAAARPACSVMGIQRVSITEALTFPFMFWGGGVSGDLGIPFTKAGKLTCEQGEAAFHN